MIVLKELRQIDSRQNAQLSNKLIIVIVSPYKLTSPICHRTLKRFKRWCVCWLVT